ncbi:MAG: OHCU decarboxylase [Herpetosiphonaceae bacterium]|nr:MAG: OHCU decarboxylase [Herpetosiphonaceae bacterium]
MNAEPAQPQLPPIDELNRLSREAFAEALKPLFETAPPLAEGLWNSRPFESYEQLLDRAEEVIAGLTFNQKIEVINAHPRIGESAAAVRQRSALSYKEQGYDAEAALNPAERERIYRELAELNRDYEARFGFKFVVFVNRRPKSAIIEVLRERMQRSQEEEMAAALNAMLAIARDRLTRLRS